MRWKAWGIGAILVAGLATALGLAWPFGRRPEVLRLPGIVEIFEVRLGPRVAGRVQAVLVTEGDVVEPGQELVRLEVPDVEAQRETLRARVREAEADLLKAQNGPRIEEKLAAQAAAQAAKARLTRLEKGFREEEKEQARSELEAARVDEGLALEEYTRVSRTIRGGASSQAELDQARANLDRARRRVAMFKARNDMYQAGARVEDIDEARADLKRLEMQARVLELGTRSEDLALAAARVDEAKSRLAELEVNLHEAVVRAPEAAVVEIVGVRPGDLVQASQPVLRVLRTGDLWVKTYIPETEMGKIHLGQRVQVTMDTNPNEQFAGKIIHIGAESEFTPRNVQTIDERKHQMFGVRVKLDDNRGVFKSGMAAEVIIPVEKD